MLIKDFQHKKVIDYLNEKRCGSATFLFSHGLGDLINFIPIFNEIQKRFRHWKLNITCPFSKNMTGLSIPFVKQVDYDSRLYMNRFTYIFNLRYPEPPIGEEISKPYFCNEVEIGLNDFQWKPYEMIPDFHVDIQSKLVGIHLEGNSNSPIKNITLDMAKTICREIRDMDYIPYICRDIHLQQMVKKIKESRYFLGIESGPFYLAGAILGYENCIGLERNMLFLRYIPMPITKINMDYYEYGQLKPLLR